MTSTSLLEINLIYQECLNRFLVSCATVDSTSSSTSSRVEDACGTVSGRVSWFWTLVACPPCSSFLIQEQNLLMYGKSWHLCLKSKGYHVRAQRKRPKRLYLPLLLLLVVISPASFCIFLEWMIVRCNRYSRTGCSYISSKVSEAKYIHRIKSCKEALITKNLIWNQLQSFKRHWRLKLCNWFYSRWQVRELTILVVTSADVVRYELE